MRQTSAPRTSLPLFLGWRPKKSAGSFCAQLGDGADFTATALPAEATFFGSTPKKSLLAPQKSQKSRSRAEGEGRRKRHSPAYGKLAAHPTALVADPS